jgi:hypothetical protein
MKNWIIGLLGVSLIAGTVIAEEQQKTAAAAAESEAEETGPFSATASVGFMSDYMWRGFKLYEGLSIQPSVDLSYDTGDFGTFSGNIWSALPGETQGHDKKFEEIDYTLAYEYSLDPVTFSIGHIFYTYPNDNTHLQTASREFYFGVSVDTIAAPTFTVYEDYDTFDNQYYELGFSHEITSEALGEGFNMTPYATFGFASNAEKVYADNGLVQVTVGTSFNLKLGCIDVIPSLNYTFKVDDLTVNEFWAGVNFGYTY